MALVVEEDKPTNPVGEGPNQSGGIATGVERVGELIKQPG
jgi:hypothetical protein